MGDEIRGVPEPASLTGGADEHPERAARGREQSIGAYLARERRLRGISVDELAELTKIPTRSIERMEAGAFDGDPDGFVRGFVRAIAVALGLDPEEAIMRMLGEPSDAADPAGASNPWLDRRAIAIAAALLVVVGLGWLIWGWASRLLSEPDADRATEIVYRRDAVRALAAEQAGEGGDERGAEDGLEPVGCAGDEHRG